MFYIESVPRINTGLFSSVKTAYVHVVTSKDVYLVTVFAMETARYCKLCMQGLRVQHGKYLRNCIAKIRGLSYGLRELLSRIRTLRRNESGEFA